MVKEYRKRPVIIKAVQLTRSKDSQREVQDFCPDIRIDLDEQGNPYGFIKTLEGTMQADPGDWIIQGVKGEFYPCKPDIFAASYEEV